MTGPAYFTRTEDVVEAIQARLGKRWIVAAPLGLGKPNRLINALYAAARADEHTRFTLMTALSLARPAPSSDLESRFLNPFLQRWFGAHYPDLDYLKDLRRNEVPTNITISEFYLQSGSMLGKPLAQRHYTSVNYTHVARDVAAAGVNLVVQMVARRETPTGPRFSLSCNTDVTFDLVERLAREGRELMVVGVVHPALPFVGNDAEVGPEFFAAILQCSDETHRLYAIPRAPVEDAEYALGLVASTLVKDGGTLQIGIGALSDALVYALRMRHTDNAAYRATVEPMLDAPERLLANKIGGFDTLDQGLYGASEMVMDGFMELHTAGILKRRVYDHLPLQKLLNRGQLGTHLRGGDVDLLIEAGVYPPRLDANAVSDLVGFGLLPEGSHLGSDGRLTLLNGARFEQLWDADARRQLASAIDGVQLRNGRYLHGAFYLGSHTLYDWLRGLKGEDYEGLCMTRVSHVNELYGGQESLHLAQRHEARFFNTCMMQTLLGAAVSDALANGQVVSGVGGQYNFVAMAHALPTGRSILMLRATRSSAGVVSSNIVWNYGHTTIPRHLRDLVLTEYGVADLRGQTDEECIQRLLGICDARFQDALAAQARSAGKLDPAWQIPANYRRNTPERIVADLRQAKSQGWFPMFPFGADFDATEVRLMCALRWLKSNTLRWTDRVRTLAKALTAKPGSAEHPFLTRMGLDNPSGWNQQLNARLLTLALRRTA